jgi:hypothetical protein
MRELDCSTGGWVLPVALAAAVAEGAASARREGAVVGW